MNEVCTCRICSDPFRVNKADVALLKRIAPTLGDAAPPLPLPTLCPPCRLRRRLAFRNNNYVFQRASSHTGNQIFSWYLPNTPFPVVENTWWWSDEWDPLDYGRDYNFSKPFFEQFKELLDVVPRPALSVQNVENSDYCNNANDLKNCYFVFNTARSEDCFYSDHIDFSKDCIDCSFSPHCELCFDCVDCTRCYNLQSSESCEQCRDSYFLLNCKNSEHCFGCANLRQAKYCIFNTQVSATEYEDFIRDARLQSYTQRQFFRAKCRAFFNTQPRPHMVGSRIEQGSGNYLHGVKNVEDSFLITDAEDCRFCFDLHSGIKDCLDVSLFGFQCEQLYECSVAGHDATSLCFCYLCHTGVSNLFYCFHCASTADCFGCVGVRRKQYCVLNKQYDRVTYYTLVRKIIAHMQSTGEWGEFFPETLSPFPYNITLADRYFPITREEAVTSGLTFYDQPITAAKNSVEASELPDSLPDTNDSIVTNCIRSGKAFRITSAEIQRYRALGIPLPRLAYDSRLEDRAQLLGGPILLERTCGKTGKSVRTTVSAEMPGMVWERAAYIQEFDS